MFDPNNLTLTAFVIRTCVQEVPSVLQALEKGAALVHTPPDAFLAVVDKSIPTACGLAGALPALPALLFSFAELGLSCTVPQISARCCPAVGIPCRTPTHSKCWLEAQTARRHGPWNLELHPARNVQNQASDTLQKSHASLNVKP